MKAIELLKLLGFGYDPGFGYTKFSWYSKDGVLMRDKFMSVIAFSTEKVDGLPFFNGKWWYIGESAIYQPDDCIIEIKDYAALKMYSPLLLWEALRISNKLSVGKPMNIVTGLSGAHAYDMGDFRERLSCFEVNGVEIKNNIGFQPQGIGAFYTLQNVLKRKEIGGIPKYYMIIDNGFNTLDIVIVIFGQEPRILSHEGKGFIQMAEAMREAVKNDPRIGKTGKTINVKDAQKIIEEGTFFFRGKTYDMVPTINAMKKQYTAGLMSFLEKKYSDLFDKFHKLYFVGGGAHAIDKNYAEHVKVVNEPEYYNAIGNLLKATGA